MGKKILFLTSSPRKSSNTNILVDWASESALFAAADVEIVDVALISYRVPGCIACMGCQQHSGFRCSIEDDVQQLLLKIPEFDVVVIATPVYFYGPNAQIKHILDRWYSLTKPDENGKPKFAKSGMTLALISTAGGSMDDGLAMTEETFSRIAEFVGMKFESLLVPHCPPMPGKIRHNSELEESAREFGKELAS